MKEVYQSIIFVGRERRDSNGNTYHTVEIIVDGIFAHYTDIQYGYGSEYEYHALVWVIDNLMMANPRLGSESPWRYFDRIGVAYHATMAKVGRKKDL